QEYQSATMIVDKRELAKPRGVTPMPSIERSKPSMPSMPSMSSSVSSASTDAPPARVVFVGEVGGDVAIEVPRSQTLLAASLNAGIPHMHECGGNARCSTCRVIVLENSANLAPRDAPELKLAQRLGFADQIRLACQTKVRGPVQVRRLILDSDDVQLTRVD